MPGARFFLRPIGSERRVHTVVNYSNLLRVTSAEVDEIAPSVLADSDEMRRSSQGAERDLVQSRSVPGWHARNTTAPAPASSARQRRERLRVSTRLRGRLCLGLRDCPPVVGDIPVELRCLSVSCFMYSSSVYSFNYTRINKCGLKQRAGLVLISAQRVAAVSGVHIQPHTGTRQRYAQLDHHRTLSQRK